MGRGALSRRRLTVGLLLGSFGGGLAYIIYKWRVKRFLKWLETGPKAKTLPQKVW
jgi:hypothetical protein